MSTAPRRMGRYRIERALGTGAFATVWLAVDEELEISVAIKALADNWSRDADVCQRFLSEARILRRINSPRVVGVHDIGSHDGGPYFVMDFIPGGTVADLPRGTAMAPATALRWGAEAAYALEELHLAGVLHRDAKPANLLVDSSALTPLIKVTDLGTAKALADSSGLTVTAGTPAYMAPEQVHGEGGFDQRADVYALAVVTYELLSDSLPFVVDGVSSVLARSPEDRPPLLAPKFGVPPQLDELLARALALDPAARPSSAREFGDDLLELAEQIDQDSGQLRAPTAPNPVARLPRSRPLQDLPDHEIPAQQALWPAARSDPARSQAGRSQAAGSQAAGTQAAGTQAAGSQAAPSQERQLPAWSELVQTGSVPAKRTGATSVAARRSGLAGTVAEPIGAGQTETSPWVPDPTPFRSGAAGQSSQPGQPSRTGGVGPVTAGTPSFGPAGAGAGTAGIEEAANDEAANDGAENDEVENDEDENDEDDENGVDTWHDEWSTVLVVLAGILLFLMVAAVMWLLLS